MFPRLIPTKEDGQVKPVKGKPDFTRFADGRRLNNYERKGGKGT